MYLVHRASIPSLPLSLVLLSSSNPSCSSTSSLSFLVYLGCSLCPVWTSGTIHVGSHSFSRAGKKENHWACGDTLFLSMMAICNTKLRFRNVPPRLVPLSLVETLVPGSTPAFTDWKKECLASTVQVRTFADSSDDIDCNCDCLYF